LEVLLVVVVVVVQLSEYIQPHHYLDLSLIRLEPLLQHHLLEGQELQLFRQLEV
jgi:hypothetical protein